MSSLNFATVNGLTLHYTLDGLSEGMPLVFINSLGSDLRIWDRLIPFFAGSFRLIRYDKRGHGLSDCPPGPYTIGDHTGDLAGLLAQLQVTEAIVIGISVGGMIALDYALSFPEKVKALVLCDTGLKIGTTESWTQRIETVRTNGLLRSAGVILPRWFTPAFAARHPADYQGYSNMLTRTPEAGYVATCEALRDADLSAAAPAIQAKTLVLTGTEDLSTPPELGRALAEALQARFEPVEQAAHLPCVEQPERMAAGINQFFQENGYV